MNLSKKKNYFSYTALPFKKSQEAGPESSHEPYGFMKVATAVVVIGDEIYSEQSGTRVILTSAPSLENVVWVVLPRFMSISHFIL